jgi:hypothetical protein
MVAYCNELVFPSAIHYQPCLIFVGKARSLPEWSPLEESTLIVYS